MLVPNSGNNLLPEGVFTYKDRLSKEIFEIEYTDISVFAILDDDDFHTTEIWDVLTSAIDYCNYEELKIRIKT